MTECGRGVTVFYHGRFFPVANGGNARFVPMLDRLSAEFDWVTLYSTANHPTYPWTKASEEAVRARWPRLDLVLEPTPLSLRIATRIKNLLISLRLGLADRLIRFAVPGATPRFEAIKRRTSLFVVSYTEGLTQMNGVDPARCFVETHDVNFVKWAAIEGRSPVSLTALRKLRGEIAMLDTVRGAIAITPGEAAFFRMMLKRPEIFYVPGWEAAPAATPVRPGVADFDLAFAGSGYVMNVRGLREFFEREKHWLSRYRIAVCGDVCDDPGVRATAADLPHVRLLGFVPNVEEVYARSRAAISPVDGTGLKMKIVSALGMGTPVFASASSMAGLPPGYEGAVFPLTEAAVAALLDDDGRLVAARAASQRYAAQLARSGDTAALLAALHTSASAS